MQVAQLLVPFCFLAFCFSSHVRVFVSVAGYSATADFRHAAASQHRRQEAAARASKGHSSRLVGKGASGRFCILYYLYAEFLHFVL